MNQQKQPVLILMAEDDPEDRMLVRKAMEKNRLLNEIRFVEDGEQLMDYLYHRNKYASKRDSPRPDLILLDLNMPRKDGREALGEIKSDPDLRHTPIIVLTTSEAEADIISSYDLGVNSYITKPVTFEKLMGLVKIVSRYWFEVVKLPTNRGNRAQEKDLEK